VRGTVQDKQILDLEVAGWKVDGNKKHTTPGAH
jgi:hypothetical protein